MSRDGLVLPLMEAVSAAGGGSASSSAAGVPTLTTPTLTPTTLRNIEQMFVESVAAECRPPDPHENAPRFEPPTVTLQQYNSDKQDAKPPPEVWDVLPGPHSNEKHLVTAAASAAVTAVDVGPAPPVVVDLPTVPLKLLPTEPVPCAAIKAGAQPCPVIIQTNGTLPEASAAPPPVHQPQPQSQPGRRRGGGSRSLTPEEEKKRALRRQRNKEAAARCRKRRLDQTISLQDEVDQWEAKNSGIHQEIKSLELQKHELEALLKSHRGVCSKAAKSKATRQQEPVIKEEAPPPQAAVKAERDDDDGGGGGSHQES